MLHHARGAVQVPSRRGVPFPGHPAGLSPAPPRQCWLLGFSYQLASKHAVFGGRAAADDGASLRPLMSSPLCFN